MTRHRLGAGAVVALLLLGACSGDDTTTEPPATTVDPYDGHTSTVYDSPESWLCHPDLTDDACAGFAATEIASDGSLQASELVPTDEPAVDCFYVYPTVSQDPGANSDRAIAPGDGERLAATSEAGPFTTTCRVFAPIYRSVTDSAIATATDAQLDLAYGDVLDAWQTYVSQDNDGRGVVLVGHSQGSIHLLRLLAEEIDSTALADRLVSALLLGWSVPERSLDDVLACRELEQVGCVISYASYAVDGMAPAGPFGQKVDQGRATCTDPVALSGDDGGLADAILPAEAPVMGRLDLGVATPFVVLPDVVEATCTRAGDYDYLSISAIPGDPRRTEELLTPQLLPFLGLHVQDAYLALGNLLTIVAAQAEAYIAG